MWYRQRNLWYPYRQESRINQKEKYWLVKTLKLTPLEPLTIFLAMKYFYPLLSIGQVRSQRFDYLFCVSAHSENNDAFSGFINILAPLFNLFQIFPNIKHQNSVSLSEIRMFPTSAFCQCVKLNLCWTNRSSVSSCFFNQLNMTCLYGLVMQV